MKVALGIPVVDSVPGETFGHHLITCAEVSKHAEVHLFCPLNMLPHSRARVEVIEGALERGCDYLFFVDDDNLVPKGAFPELMKVMKESRPAVVTGHYHRRGFPYDCVWSKLIDGRYRQVDASKGVHDIDSAGLGCALIDLKWVSAHLKAPYFEMLQGDRGIVVADDVTFYRKVKDAGGLILGHAGIRCGHVGHRVMITTESARMLRREELMITSPQSALAALSGQKDVSNGTT